MISPEIVAQAATIITAVWFSARGVHKRINDVENKIDRLPCNNGNCPVQRPKILVVGKQERS